MKIKTHYILFASLIIATIIILYVVYEIKCDNAYAKNCLKALKVLFQDDRIVKDYEKLMREGMTPLCCEVYVLRTLQNEWEGKSYKEIHQHQVWNRLSQFHLQTKHKYLTRDQKMIEEVRMNFEKLSLCLTCKYKYMSDAILVYERKEKEWRLLYIFTDN